MVSRLVEQHKPKGWRGFQLEKEQQGSASPKALPLPRESSVLTILQVYDRVNSNLAIPASHVPKLGRKKPG
jgi:hypothetical protein